MQVIRAILQAIHQLKHTSGVGTKRTVEPAPFLDSLSGLTSDLVLGRVHVVSDAFQGMSLIQRHRLVHTALDEELKASVHALSLRLKTPSEE